MKKVLYIIATVMVYITVIAGMLATSTMYVINNVLEMSLSNYGLPPIETHDVFWASVMFAVSFVIMAAMFKPETGTGTEKPPTANYGEQ